MHAVAVKVNIGDAESAQKELNERVVPSASGAPGAIEPVFSWVGAAPIAGFASAASGTSMVN